MNDGMLRLHHMLAGSRVNGPGSRFVIWTQGCSFNCPGCFNPETFPLDEGSEYSVDALAAKILSAPGHLDGITVSGGEPLLQHRPLRRLLSILHGSADLGVILFTGFTWGEMGRIPQIQHLWAEIDLVIAGRYQHSLHQGRQLIGSSNKTLHFLTTRYRLSDLDVPPAEVVISPDGIVNLSGIDPLIW